MGATASVVAGSQQKKAAGKLAGAYKNPQLFQPTELKDPQKFNSSYTQLRAIDDPFDRLEYANRLNKAVNAYTYHEAMNYYKAMQPSFVPIQRQVGENALAFSRGELPQDTVASIGRAAAQRGIQGGFGYGSQGGKNGALANLNLRNLGLTSLDLTKYGTQLGMQVNQSAKSLMPNMRHVSDWLLTPQQSIGLEQYNLNAQNDVDKYNNQLINQAAMTNAGVMNASREAGAKAAYQGDLAQAQMIQSIGNSVGGAMGSMGSSGMFGGSSVNSTPASGIGNTQYFTGSTGMQHPYTPYSQRLA